MSTRPRPLVWLYDLRDAQALPLHDFAELQVEDRLGDLEVLTFVIRADDPKRGWVLPDVQVSYAGRRYRVEELREYREGPRTLVEVRAEALWMDLGKFTHPGSMTVYGQTALAGLSLILAGTGWLAGTVTPATATLYSIDAVDASALSLLRAWSVVSGYEVSFDTVAKTVSLVDQLGEDRGIGFRWGHNVRNIERRYTPPTATRQYAYGANSLTIAGPNPTGLEYVEDFSWYTAQGLTLAEAKALYRKDDIWTDDRYLSAVNLYDAAVRRLALLAQPTIAYELAVVDLAALTSTTADDVAIGDTVRVRDQGFDLDLTTRVVRLLRYPLAPHRNEVELNYLRPGLTVAPASTYVRQADYSALSVVVDMTETDVTVDASTLLWSEMTTTVTGAATAILGGTFQGIASGTGTLQVWVTVDGVDLGPRRSIVFTAGQEVEHSWPSYTAGLAEGSHTVTYRAAVTSGTGTIAVTNGNARGWMLIRGGVGVGFDSSPNQYIAEALAALVPTIVAQSAAVTIAVTTPGTEDHADVAATETIAASTPTVAALSAAVTVTLI